MDPAAAACMYDSSASSAANPHLGIFHRRCPAVSCRLILRSARCNYPNAPLLIKNLKLGRERRGGERERAREREMHIFTPHTSTACRSGDGKKKRNRSRKLFEKEYRWLYFKTTTVSRACFPCAVPTMILYMEIITE